jgi:hypothetical protein
MRAWGLLSTALGSARRVPSSAALRGVRPPARLGARRASADRREVHARWSAGAGAVPGGAPGLDDAC